jgi:hypothetical protein
MNEENNNVASNDGGAYNTEIKKEDIINNTEVNNIKNENTASSSDASVISETPSNISAEKSSNIHEDVSKVKIRTILKQRFKKSNPILKKVIPLIIVGIICFGAGLIAGKEIDRHSNRRVIFNRNGMFRQMPNRNFNGGNFNKKQFNSNSNNGNNNSKNNQQQSTTPPATNNQPQ